MQSEKTDAACTPDTPIDAAASCAGAPRGHRIPFLPLPCTAGGVVCHVRQSCPQPPVFRAVLSGNAARHSCLHSQHQQALSYQGHPGAFMHFWGRGGSHCKRLQPPPHQGQGHAVSCPKGRN